MPSAPRIADTRAGYRLEFTDDFRSPVLDRGKWLPCHLPQWSSRAAAAATYATGDDGLVLTVAPGQPAWCPEFDGPIRVSSLQTGVFSGPAGSLVGQHRFSPALRVREVQPEERLYVPTYGFFEMRARMEIGPGHMAALWTVGFEDVPEHSGEMTLMEIFGDDIAADSAVLGHGIKPIHDPLLRPEFHQDRLSFNPAEFHIYAADWSPAGVEFFFDDRLLHRTAQSPDYPMQFMLDVYELRAGTARPPTMNVDYFRGWQRQ